MADQIPSDLRYSKDHEWARVQGDVARIGITWHAQDQLGDVVFVELPAAGSKVEKGKQFGVVESTKAVSELFSPVTGTVKSVNEALSKSPDQVNSDPYGKAWMIEVQLANPAEVNELLDAKGYGELTKA